MDESILLLDRDFSDSLERAGVQGALMLYEGHILDPQEPRAQFLPVKMPERVFV